MIKKNKIVEGIDSIETDYTTYKKIKGTLPPTTKVKITGDKPIVQSTSTTTTPTSSYPVSEEENIIEPQDKTTIKYLSNIMDSNTGELSKPFTISGKNYQMVRGKLPSKEIVIGVYCHDDLNENGENVIYSIDDFDKNIATPMREMENEIGKNDNYEGYKHYLVNKHTNEVRKFKSIKELMSQHKLDEEDYMGVREFKQHMNEKMFGSRKKTDVLTELSPTGEESDEEMNVKAKKLMVMIKKRIPENIITTIKSPIAKREVIAAFAEMIGVPRNGLSNLISGLKNIASTDVAQPISEKKVLTKNELIESLKIKNR
jgi:hypothetical protein